MHTSINILIAKKCINGMDFALIGREILMKIGIAVGRKGELMIKPIKVHPVNSASIILWGDDGNKEHTLIKARNCVASIISFDKRQIWEVYPYKEHSGDVGYCGACERKGMYIRLMPDDFIRIFGKDIVDRVDRVDRAERSTEGLKEFLEDSKS